MKKLFKKLLTDLSDKDILDESKVSELQQTFSEKLSEYKEKIYAEAEEKIDLQHTRSLNKVLRKIDEDHTAGLNKVVRSVTKKHKKELMEMDKRHTEGLKQVAELLEHKSDALENFDEEACRGLEKVQKLLEEKDQALIEMDRRHTRGLEKVARVLKERYEDKIEFADEDRLQEELEKLDAEHTAGLKKVIEFYEDKYTSMIEEKINDYLDVYLEEVAPDDKLVDKYKLNKLDSLYTEMKDLLIGTEVSLDEEIKEAILDANSIIESKDEEINELMQEKIELSKEIKLNEAKQLLESKIQNVNPRLKSYLKTRFKNATVNEIEETFEEAVSAFTQDEQVARQRIKQSVSSKVNPRKVLTEDVIDDRSQQTNSLMDRYVTKYINSQKYNK